MPDARSEQLRVKHPADDDGLWFFEIVGSDVQVQAESSTGMCPFLVESTASADRLKCATVGEAIDAVVHLLTEPKLSNRVP